MTIWPPGGSELWLHRQAVARDLRADLDEVSNRHHHRQEQDLLYRCLGFDDYRHQGDRVCGTNSVRADYLDRCGLAGGPA